MSKSISLREANQAFARCIREVEAEVEYVITRNGHPFASLVPFGGRRVLSPEQQPAAFAPVPGWKKGARRGWTSRP